MNKSINNSRGVSYDEYFAKKRNASPAKGLAAEKQRGVPLGSFVMTDDCHGITKQGEPCKARPAKGGNLCAGHRKQAEASF